MSSIQSTARRYVRGARRRLARLAARTSKALEPTPPGKPSTAPPSTPAEVNGVLSAMPPSLRKDARILEIGSGDGTNLAALVAAGYTRVEGWVGAPADADAIRGRNRALAATTIHVGFPVIDALAALPDDHFSLAIADGTLRSVPDPASLTIEVVRVASDLIVIDERASTDGDVDTTLTEVGMTKVREAAASGLPECIVREYRRMERLSTLHDFWRQPAPQGNEPEGYIARTGRSQALAEIIADLPRDARILEIGCNVGRNLAHLHDVGYRGVEGIEINPNAIALLRKTFSQLDDCRIHEGPAGDHLPNFADDEFDLVFTMAVIEHLHPDEAATVFDDMVRVGKEIVAIEPEGRITHRQYPHDVPATFTSRGLEMVLAKPMSEFPSNAGDAAMTAFTAFRFRRHDGGSGTTEPATTEYASPVRTSEDWPDEWTESVVVEIDQLMADLADVEAPFQPTTFWRPAVRQLREELSLKGVARFKSWASAQQFFYPQYGQCFNQAQLERVGRYAATVNRSAQAPWATSRLSGGIDAHRDLDIALALIDRNLIDLDLLAHGESTVGRPPQQYALAGAGGPIFGRPYLNYAKLLAALSTVIESPPRSVLELGGGFGVLGELLHQYRKDSVYIDVDIPPLTSIAGWYLSQAVDGKPIHGPLESLPDDDSNLWATGFVASLPSWRLGELRGRSFDVFVNAYSFQEMEPDTVAGYAEIVAEIAPTYVVSQNSRSGKPLATAQREVGVTRQTTSEMIIEEFVQRGYGVVRQFGRPAAPPSAELVVLRRQTSA